MSYNNKLNNKSAKKPFCKVCQDAGKPESVYTSHFVRTLPDINGKTSVTCPILAVTECRYCCELGHTTKFCPVLEKNEKRNKKEKSVAIQAHKSEQRAASRPVSEAVVERKYAGAFAALSDDSDDEKPVPQKVVAVPVDHFPALFGSKKEVASTEKRAVSWAVIAEKPAAHVLKPIVKPIVKNTPQIASKSWADYSDSDSDEDEFQSAYNAPCYADEDW
jgi:hypothetical protein